LQPIGLELFFVDAASAAALLAAGGATGGGRAGACEELTSGPVWDQPSAFFAFRYQRGAPVPPDADLELMGAFSSSNGFGRGPDPDLSSQIRISNGSLILG
jgi:hypothetical protein